MSSAQILLLGALAGLTIFLGLPFGRIANPSPRLQAALAAVATGILVFLLWDVLSEGLTPVENALDARAWGRFSGYAALLGGGFALGLMSLVYYDRWMARQRGRTLIGPGAASAAEFERHRAGALSPARFLSLLIATGIGLHNFSEGLAIGQSAAKDEMSLALMLIIGFGLHNATEGFGIVAPLCGDRERPSWRFLALLGLIGGGPTFFGTVIGQAFVSVPLEILFFALAAGSILYVVMELFNVMRKLGDRVVVGWALFGGIVLGFGTDFVLHAVGA